MAATDSQPIGIFDSGLGGLSVLREVRRQMPAEPVLFFADQGRLPYGPRPASEIRLFAEQITRFLLARRAQAVVVACNTASAAALKHLRQVFPQVPIVGMEPAVKPAAAQTRSRVVGVLGTESTVQSQVFASVVERFANGVRVLPRACPGLVTQVEAGQFDSPGTLQMLHEYIDPLLEAGIDSLVLACTHFAFLTGAMRKVVGPDISIIDPAPAVARQVGRVIGHRHLAGAHAPITAFSTGPTDPSGLAASLLGEPIEFELLAASALGD